MIYMNTPGVIGYYDFSKRNFDFEKNHFCNEDNLRKYSGNGFSFEFLSNGKFENDKIFENDNDIFLCLNGVVLNKSEIKSKRKEGTFFQVIKKLYLENESKFLRSLHGDYNGFLIDFNNNKVVLFTNHLGVKPLYYFYDKTKSSIFFASNFIDLVRLLSKHGISPAISEFSAYQLLTYGYLLEDNTLFNEVKKVKPGSVISVKANVLNQQSYYKIDNTKFNTESIENQIDKLHYLLNFAVKQELEKDLEYGYSHLTLLSGGLDSRMLQFYAHLNNYENVTNITFGQFGSPDTIIANQISSYLGYNCITRSLDGGNYLKDFTPNQINGGLVSYFGAAHTYSTLNSINLNNYGLLHNGNLADIVQGDYTDAPYHTKPKPLNWAFSKKLANRIESEVLDIGNKYPNEELFAIYNRGINGIFNGNVMAHYFTETATPYLNPDVMDYAMKIPPEYKYKEKLFILLINKYFKEATEFKWEKWNKKPIYLHYYYINTSYYKFYRRVVRYTKRKILNGNPASSTNPYDYWLKNNSSLSLFVENEFNNNIDILTGQIRKDASWLFNTGHAQEKMMVIGLLNIIKTIKDIQNTK